MLEGNADQFKQIISKRNHLLDDKILLVCNLSSEVTEAHIRRLFNGLFKKIHSFIQLPIISELRIKFMNFKGFQIDDIRLSYFDKTKEIMAFVQFLSISDADAAIELFGQKILKKYYKIIFKRFAFNFIMRFPFIDQLKYSAVQNMNEILAIMSKICWLKKAHTPIERRSMNKQQQVAIIWLWQLVFHQA